MKLFMKKLPPFLVAIPLLSSCFAPSVRIDDLPGNQALTIGLDANAHSAFPGRRLKFWVDIVNNELPRRTQQPEDPPQRRAFT